VHATYDDQPDASFTESELESQHSSADGSSPVNELEVEIATNMDDIDHDRIYT